MRFVVVFCALMILAAPASALTTTLGERYAPEETAIARVEGALVSPPSPEQVEFRRGHVLVPFEYDVGMLDTTTYIWLRAPRTEGNYTLIIKDVQTLVEGIPQLLTYRRNFSVAGALIPYAVRPGFVSANTDFSLIIDSYRDEAQTVQVSHPTQRELVLAPGQNQHLISAASLPANTLTLVEIGTYRIPVYLKGNTTISRVQRSRIWEVEPERVNFVFSAGRPLSTSFLVHATYRGTKELKNVAPQLNTSLFSVTPSSFKSIKPNETLLLPITFEFQRDTQNTTSVQNASSNETLPYCSQLSGIVCRSSDTCSVPALASRDGPCCTGTCNPPQKKSKAWLGYLIVGIILFGIALAWLRYKKVKPQEPLRAALARAHHP